MKIEANVNTHGNRRTSRVNNAIWGEIFWGKLQTISQGKLSSQETTKSSFVHLITQVFKFAWQRKASTLHWGWWLSGLLPPEHHPVPVNLYMSKVFNTIKASSHARPPPRKQALLLDHPLHTIWPPSRTILRPHCFVEVVWVQRNCMDILQPWE